MKPEQAKAILAEAPKSSNYADAGGSQIHIDSTTVHNLDDLQIIVEQQERIEALEKSLAGITKNAWDSMGSIEKLKEAEKLLGE